MLVKAVILFLVAMALIAWIGGFLGKLRLPGAGRSAKLDRYCPSCGRPRIGKGSCSCGRT